ncbi:RNA polymerase-associated protein RTF1 homolog [Drosophila virilis]|nr:RNA polymerase-associated protein RTF1 homolog [Drosophila virilis]
MSKVSIIDCLILCQHRGQLRVIEMSGAKPKTSGKSKSKLKRSSPRLYDTSDLPSFMQPQKLSWNVTNEKRLHRPKSEIVRELRRLRSLPVRSDDDEEQDPTAAAAAAAEPIRTLEQLDALRLTRHRIEQLLHSTTFEQAVRSCFVRLNINPINVLPEYRIAEIMDITELPEGYYVGKTPTNIALQLRYEDLVMKHELNDISNMAFTREEFDFWHDNCICQAIEWPTTELISQKKVELYNALNSEGKISSLLKQNGLLPLAMPMRPVPKGGLLERLGGVYPWKLQRPPPPPPPPALPNPELEAVAGSEGSGELTRPEPGSEELEARRSEPMIPSA